MKRVLGIGCVLVVYVAIVVALVMRPWGYFRAQTNFEKKTPFFSVLRSVDSVIRGPQGVRIPVLSGAVFDIVLPSRFSSVDVVISCAQDCPSEIGLYNSQIGDYSRTATSVVDGGAVVALDTNLAMQQGRKFVLRFDGGAQVLAVEVVARKPSLTVGTAWEKFGRFLGARIMKGI